MIHPSLFFTTEVIFHHTQWNRGPTRKRDMKNLKNGRGREFHLCGQQRALGASFPLDWKQSLFLHRSTARSSDANVREPDGASIKTQIGTLRPGCAHPAIFSFTEDFKSPLGSA